MRTRAVVVLSALVLVATVGCGDDDSEADEASTETTGAATDDSEATSETDPVGSDPSLSGESDAGDESPGGDSGGDQFDGVALIDGTPLTGVIDCYSSPGDDGATLEMIAQVSNESGAFADIRLVTTPPSIGDSSFSFELTDYGLIEEELADGAVSGEIGGLLYELDESNGTFILFGEASFEDGSAVDVDIETGCELLS